MSRKVGGVAAVAAIGAVVAVLVVRSTPDERQGEPAAATATTLDRTERPRHRKLSRVVEGVRFSFEVPGSWEPGPIKRLPDLSGSRNARLFISQSTRGPQGAEAVVFWTSFPDGGDAAPCANLLRRPVGPSAADLVSAMARTPGIRVVKGASDATVGGRPAKHAVFQAFMDLGCDPGFFFTWRPRGPRDECWGACWLESSAGDTIRVWVVEVDATRLVLQAETSDESAPYVEQEIRQLVESIRFDS